LHVFDVKFYCAGFKKKGWWFKLSIARVLAFFFGQCSRRIFRIFYYVRNKRMIIIPITIAIKDTHVRQEAYLTYSM